MHTAGLVPGGKKVLFVAAPTGLSSIAFDETSSIPAQVAPGFSPALALDTLFSVLGCGEDRQLSNQSVHLLTSSGTKETEMMRRPHLEGDICGQGTMLGVRAVTWDSGSASISL